MPNEQEKQSKDTQSNLGYNPNITTTPLPIQQYTSSSVEMQNMFKKMSNDINTKKKNRTYNDMIMEEQMILQNHTIRSAEDLNPIKATDYSTSFDSMYSKLNSGKNVTRYDSFIPGVNMEEYYAQRQTKWDKWQSGVAKALVNTGTVIAGGTVGFFDALFHIPEAIQEGSLDPMFNSEFAQSLDDVNTKMQNKFANYYSADEQNRSLFGQLGTANFWADKFLGGLSFTVGTIMSEGLWAVATGGLSLSKTVATSGMTAGRFSSYLANIKSIGKQLFSSALIPKSGLTGVGKALDWAHKARFVATSSGFEAGMEARMMMKEAEENYLKSYRDVHGTNPSAEELNEFKQKNIEAGNSVFLANMGILGVGNLALYGGLVGIKPLNLGIGKAIDKTLFGIGSKEVMKDGVKMLESVSRTGFQKGLGRVYSISKPVLTEGLWEEGGQGIASFTAKDWLEQGYDPKRAKDNIGVIDNFNKALEHQFGTKEGQTDLLLGALIGLAGGGMSGQFSMMKNKVAENEYNIKTQNSFGRYSLLNRLQSLNRVTATEQKIKKAKDSGDITAEHLGIKEQIFNVILADYKTNEIDLGTERLSDILDSASPEEMERATGIKDVEEQTKFKKELLDEYKKGVKTFESQREHIEAIVGDGKIKGVNIGLNGKENENLTASYLKDALSYHFFMGTEVEKVGSTILENIRSIVSKASGKDISQALSVQDALRIASLEKRNEYRDLDKKIDEKKKKLKELDKQRLDQEKLRATAEDTKKATAKLNEINNAIIEEQTNRDRLLDEKVALVRTLEMDNVFSTLSGGTKDSIMYSDLENVTEDLKYIDNLMNQYAKTNPKLYAEYQANLREYERARKAFVNFNETAKTIYSKDFNIKNTKNNFISNRFSNTEQNEYTAKFIETAIKDYMKNSNKLLMQSNLAMQSNKKSDVSDEEYEKFVSDNKDVSVDLLTRIANKIVGVENQSSLSEREKEIHKSHKREIAKIAKEINRNKKATIQATNIELQKNESNTKTTFTKDNLEQKLRDILNKNSFTKEQFYNEQTNNYEIPKGLSDEEIDEWNDLRNKINEDDAIVDKNQPNKVKSDYYDKRSKSKGNKPNISKKELARYKELSTKLASFKLVEGTVDKSGTSLLDLIISLNQLNQNIENQSLKSGEEKLKTNLTEDEVLNIKALSELEFSESVSNKNFIQSYDTAKVKITKDKSKGKDGKIFYQFSHLNIETILDQLLKVDSIESISITQKNGAVHSDIGLSRKEVGAVFTVKMSSGKVINIKVENKHGNLTIEKSEYDALNPFILIDSGLQKNSYFDVYEKLDDGLYRPLQSDYKLETVNKSKERRELSIDQIYELYGGSVRLIVSLEDRYNIFLEEQYKSGRISEEELVDQVKIYVISDNKVVGEIKAGDFDKNKNSEDNKSQLTVSKSDSAAVHNQIRQIAKEKFLETIETASREVNLNITIPVEKIYKGSPNLELDTTDSIVIKPKSIEFDEQSVKLVSHIGVLIDGVSTDEEFNQRIIDDNIDMSYVKRLSHKNKQTKIPFIVFKFRNKYDVAFPINLIQSPIDLTADSFKVINDDKLTDAQKVIALNNLLLENGLDIEQFGISPLQSIESQEDKVNNTLDKIKQINQRIDVENLKPIDLIGNATINVNITDKPFISPKVMLDLKKATIKENEDSEIEINILDSIKSVKDDEIDIC